MSIHFLYVYIRRTAGRLCSGQVITEPAAAVKELIENALDAGATKIRVECENGGMTRISVSDNGSGISEANLKKCALGHYTSKLEQLSDLEHHNEYGFRGEALHALATVGTLTIRTRCKVGGIRQIRLFRLLI